MDSRIIEVLPDWKDPYYFLPECSNSDLSWLKSFFEPEPIRFDKEKAYRFGTLLDCQITEPHKVNYFRLTCCGNQYTREEFALAERMKLAFYRDEFCTLLAQNSLMQKITINRTFKITYMGVTFCLPFRIKWDLNAWASIQQGGDIKSTTAETWKQFEAACYHFEYFRQRAVYMDVEGVDRDVLIGVSKKNCQVFKIAIERGDKYHQLGVEQYSRLGFQYATLFGTIKAA